MRTKSLLWSFGLMAFAVFGFGFLDSRAKDLGSGALGDPYELPKPSPAAVVSGCDACGGLEGLETRVAALEARMVALESVAAVRRSVAVPAAPAVVRSSVRSVVRDPVPGHWTHPRSIEEHLRLDHGVSASGSREELLTLHDALHEGTFAASAPVVVSSAPAVVRSTYRSAPVRSGFRLFGRARTCPAGGCP